MNVGVVEQEVGLRACSEGYVNCLLLYNVKKHPSCICHFIRDCLLAAGCWLLAAKRDKHKASSCFTLNLAWRRVKHRTILCVERLS